MFKFDIKLTGRPPYIFLTGHIPQFIYDLPSYLVHAHAYLNLTRQSVLQLTVEV